MTQASGNRPWYKRWWLRLSVIGLVVLALCLALRVQLLRGLGSFLIVEDELVHADAIYALGGAPLDRGTQAGILLNAGVAPVAYCTGANHSSVYKAEGRLVTEAELTRAAAIRAGASPDRVLPFLYGTSTYEEAQGVLHHAQRLHLDTIIVLTTDFHTRRVGKVFRKRFAGSGIHVLVAGAPASEYEVGRWWESEQGLLMVNNEYVKSLFYLLKY